MLKFLALLLCVAVVYGQIPSPCFAPPQLSFHARWYNQELTTFRHFDAAYDGQGERFGFYELEETNPAPGRQLYHIVILHREGVIYEYNRNTRTCHKSPAGRFHPFAVPPDARFEAEYYVGGPGEDFEATEWSDRSDVRREEWIGVFTRINCYPVRTWARNEQTNETIHNHIYNLVTGIENPTLFEPERECMNATIAKPSSLTNSLLTMFRGEL